MPRYFFNVHRHDRGHDSEGGELPNDAAAWREATLAAGELLKEIDGKFQPGEELQVEVVDERRKPPFLIRVIAEKK